MRRSLSRFVSVVVLASLPMSSVLAQVPAKAEPDPSKNPILAKMQNMGGEFFYMGTEYGMDGWFIVKNGQVQMMYSTPDNKAAMVGVLFGEDGTNLTMQQAARVVRENKKLSDLIDAAQKEHDAIMGVGSRSMAGIAPNLNPNVIPSAALSSGERLLSELSSAAAAAVGKEGAPEVAMIISPLCSHCKATWKSLSKAVSDGKLRVRLVPAAEAKSEGERVSAVLLGLDSPSQAWEKYVAGDKSVLAGTPSEAALSAVRVNTAIADKWKISNLPYLVYRAADGKVKVVKGEVTEDGVAAIFKDLGV